MDGTVRRILFGKCHHAQIGKDQPVCAHFVQCGKILGQTLHLVIPGQRIDRDVYLDAAGMAIHNRLTHFLQGKVVRGGAHPVGLPRQINGIGAIRHSKAQLFHIPRGGKDFRFFHSSYFPAATSATARLCSSSVRLKIWLPSGFAT